MTADREPGAVVAWLLEADVSGHRITDATADTKKRWEFVNDGGRDAPLVLATDYAAMRARAEADARRLAWLELRHVEVRELRLHGSTKRFVSVPDWEDEDECPPSDLRQQIDTAIAGQERGRV